MFNSLLLVKKNGELPFKRALGAKASSFHSSFVPASPQPEDDAAAFHPTQKTNKYC